MPTALRWISSALAVVPVQGNLTLQVPTISMRHRFDGASRVAAGPSPDLTHLGTAAVHSILHQPVPLH